MATRPAKPTAPATAQPRHRDGTSDGTSAGARPRALRLAAAVQAVEAVGMCVAAGFAAVSTADGQSYQRASGIALTLIAVGTAVVFALFAAGPGQGQAVDQDPGGHDPAGHRRVGDLPAERTTGSTGACPMLLVAACCLAALFTPASLRALNRP